MAPNLKEFQDPTKLDDILKEQQSQYDCLPCRAMGSTAFIGLGAYTWYSGRNQLAERELEIVRSGTRIGMGARKASLFVTSVALVGLGAYRWWN